DIRLLNTKISLNANAAIAFGVNIRNFVYALNGSSNWQDTISQLSDFMKINIGNLPLSGKSAGSSWAEIYGTYAMTIIDDGKQALNAGITVKISRALAGGYANAAGIFYVPLADGTGYLVTGGNIQYGYSANFDRISSNNTSVANKSGFLRNAFSSPGADIGVEYMVFSSCEEDEGSEDAYDTKIGISLMDVGGNKYRYGSRSRQAAGPQPGV